jgi:hypothetical protein
MFRYTEQSYVQKVSVEEELNDTILFLAKTNTKLGVYLTVSLCIHSYVIDAPTCICYVGCYLIELMCVS